MKRRLSCEKENVFQRGGGAIKVCKRDFPQTRHVEQMMEEDDDGENDGAEEDEDHDVEDDGVENGNVDKENQAGVQDNDTFMQNERTKKIKQQKQTKIKTNEKKIENQEDLMGQSASDIVFFVFVCSFACSNGSLVICLQFCMPQGKDAES